MTMRSLAVVAGVLLLATACVNYVPVSVASNGAEADAPTDRWSLSADGQYGVFVSAATNLGDNPSGVAQIWRRDLHAGVTELVSVSACAAAPCPGADTASRAPDISANGRFVVFESDATDLTAAGNPTGFSGVYLVDLQTSTTVALSAAGGDSSGPTISANGLKVAFNSENPSLVAGDTNGVADVFVYSVFPTGFERVSVGAAGVEADGPSSQALISGDGAVVAFYSEATNLGDPTGDSFYRRADGATSVLFADPPHTEDLRIDSFLRATDGAGERFAFQRFIEEFRCPFFGCFFYNDSRLLFIDAAGAPLINAQAVPPHLPGESTRTYSLPNVQWPDRYPQISEDGTQAIFLDPVAPLYALYNLFHSDLDGAAPTMLPDQPAIESAAASMSSDGAVLVVEHNASGAFYDPEGPVEARLTFAPVITGVVPDGPVVPGATVDLTISGAHFQAQLLVLSNAGGFLTNVVVVDESTATATLTIGAGVAPGDYDIGALVSKQGLIGQSNCVGCLTVE